MMRLIKRRIWKRPLEAVTESENAQDIENLKKMIEQAQYMNRRKCFYCWVFSSCCKLVDASFLYEVLVFKTAGFPV